MNTLKRIAAVMLIGSCLVLSAFAVPNCPTSLHYNGDNPDIIELFGTELALTSANGSMCYYAGGIELELESSISNGGHTFWLYDGRSFSGFYGYIYER
jgi:hypothetical protein